MNYEIYGQDSDERVNPPGVSREKKRPSGDVRLFLFKKAVLEFAV